MQTGAAPGFAMNTGVRISVAGGNDIGVSYTSTARRTSTTFDGTGLHLPFPDALQEFRLTTGRRRRGGTFARRVGERGDQIGHQRAARQRVRVPARQPLQRAGLPLRPEGRAEAQSVRRHAWRADRHATELFFFVGYQGTTTRQNPLDQLAFVPTAAMLAGDFTAFASPACNSGRQLALGGRS